MFRPRVIPCLLLKGKGLVKTTKFQNTRYVGDPINAVRIFNEKEADELIFLDINASKENRILPLDLIQQIGDECLMPFSVGGGIKTVEQIRDILKRGAEKAVINTSAVKNPSLIKEASQSFGSQSIVVSIDVKRKSLGRYEVFIYGGTKSTSIDPVSHSIKMEKMGAGEIFINSIDNDGTLKGYDIELIRKISEAVKIPVIASGGAGKLEDFLKAVKDGFASAVAAGSFFVYYGPHRAVLINYPNQDELKKLFMNKGNLYLQ